MNELHELHKIYIVPALIGKSLTWSEFNLHKSEHVTGREYLLKFVNQSYHHRQSRDMTLYLHYVHKVLLFSLS